MSFDLIEYYKALNGESSLSNDTWHINYDKRHAFRVYSDTQGYNPSAGGMSLPPSTESTETINTFSDKDGQQLINTRIIDDGDGTESVELELADRVVTIVMDHSGSMTWNDNGKFRYDVAKDLVEKIDINYSGDIKYNLIDYGAKFISVLLFGVIEEDGINPYDVNSLNAMFQADEDANYDGIRVVRNTDAYPTSPLNGEIINDGFTSRILDSDLTDGQTYYYTIYTYDNLGRFSEGVNIKVIPRDRVIPRGISIFRTAVETTDLSTGEPFMGSGVNRDDNTIGIWHLDEGEGIHAYDFSQSGAVLTTTSETPVWAESNLVPSGTSGLFFDGATDVVSMTDSDNNLEIDFTGGNNKFTIMAWVLPYDVTNSHYVFSRASATEVNYFLSFSSGLPAVSIGGAAPVSSDLSLTEGVWQHLAVTYNGDTGDIVFYINGVSNTKNDINAVAMTTTQTVSIGNSQNLLSGFWGNMTEVSVHNVVRSATYINAQLIDSPITVDGVEIGTEKMGIRDDNGDRLVVLDYEIPEDYNFSGGEVFIVKNEKHIPSWEEDGTIIYQESAAVGRVFVSDPDDFMLGEKYYYRIFSRNLTGNVSFQSDSPSLEISIPESLTDDYFLALASVIPPPEDPSIGDLITPGNGKVYLRWKQGVPLDPRIARVKIYYSSEIYPIVSNTGGNTSELVYTGLVTDTKFVHRNLDNNIPAYYTIINIDKYGRPSNYDPDGTQSAGSDFLHASTTPTASADEGTIPLIEVENLNYEIRDSSSISIGWDQPVKSPEDIDVYFDQTVLVYSSLTDEFGDVLPEYASIKMYIVSSIERETQADDVFNSMALSEFEDKDAYDFFVTRTEQGFLKGTLRMTSNKGIISQIKSATFTIQLKSYIPREGGYDPPNTASSSTDSLSEYASLISELAGAEEIPQETSSDNIFEYLSQPFTVHFTNPWEITLESKFDSQRVYERCYYITEDPITHKESLNIDNEMFYGVPMRASSPFVARAKVTYKGEPVENATLQASVWDADSSDLCAGAGGDSVWGFEGAKLQPSQTVLPPDTHLSIIQGTEDQPGRDDVPISYVDIPLYAPDTQQAVRLFVKGEQSGYSSVKEMYILFQSLLRIEIDAHRPVVDGADVQEQFSNAFVINPDYPNLSDPYALSLTTPVSDLTIIQWNINRIRGENYRNIYSIDNVPITNGVYSYTRNGQARNVFMGPIQIGGGSFDEAHEISVDIVYEGMTANAKSWITLKYDPTESATFGARFLMEVDGNWRNNGTFSNGGWMNPEGSPLWTDGFHYVRMKIHRNPAVDPEFLATDAFTVCAGDDDSQVFELNSGQIVTISAGDDTIEILHGEITEELDPYTGLYSLVVGEDGFIDRGSAFVELNDEDNSDVTYFYIRANQHRPGSGVVYTEYLLDEEPINECLQLNPADGLFLRDLPNWSPYLTVSGTTTLFVNDQPLILRGGGDYYTGIPPCPICLLEPLGVEVIWRRVTNYFYSETLGDPSNEFLYSIVTTADTNQFRDDDGETLIKNTSDIDIRVRVVWKGGNVPDGTPIYTSIGDNTSGTIFVANQNIYYTQTDVDIGYSYVDVNVEARRVPPVTTTEALEIYSVYDENGKTTRRVGANFDLTLDVKDIIVDPPIIDGPDPDPSVEEPVIIDPFTGILHKYDINTDVWSVLTGMSEGKGDSFIGEVNGKMYVMGGLLNNSLNISNKTEEYDIVTDLWIDKAIMSIPRFGGMSVTIGNDIYVIGGIFRDLTTGNGLSVSTSVEVYHTDTDLWDELSDMPTANSNLFDEEELGVAFGTAQHVTIGSNNYIYIIGGISSVIATGDIFSIRKYSERILRYYVEGNTWEYSGILTNIELNTYKRISSLSLTHVDKIIVFNGAQGTNSFTYPSEDFSIDIEETFANTPTGGYWVKHSGLLDGYPIAKFQSTMVRYDDNPSVDTNSEYYILGGGNATSTSLDILENLSATPTDFNYVSSYDSNASVALSHLLMGRHGAGAIYSDADGSPAIYLVGGYTIAQDSTYIDITIDI